MDEIFSNAQRAEVLTQALPNIRHYNGKIVVVKYGGNAMINEELKNAVMGDLVLLNNIRLGIAEAGFGIVTDIDNSGVVDGNDLALLRKVLLS